MNDFASQQTLANLMKELDGPYYGQDVASADNTVTVVADENEEIIELGDSFSMDKFQVVRREFFAHLKEPAATFTQCKFSVNAACIAKFPDTEYVQVLINQEDKMIALRPCEEGARDSYAWCGLQKGKRKPKAITCKMFFAKICDLMNWNPDYRYKMLGRLVHANGEYLIAFDLTACETYQRTCVEGEKPKASRTPVFPAGWQNQFGLPYSEHKQSMQINIFDGYAIYAIKDNTQNQTDPQQEPGGGKQ